MNPKRMIFLSTMRIFGVRVSFRMYIFLLRLLWMIHIPLSKEGALGGSPFLIGIGSAPPRRKPLHLNALYTLEVNHHLKQNGGSIHFG